MPAPPLAALPETLTQREALAQWARDGAAYRNLASRHGALGAWVKERCQGSPA